MGIFDRLKRRKTEEPSPAQDVGEFAQKSEAATEKEPQPSGGIKKADISVQRRIGDDILIYHYDGVPFTRTEEAEQEVERMAESVSWEVSVSVISGVPCIFHGGINLGALTERTKMTSDWLKKGDPIKAWLSSFGQKGDSVFIAFYRNEQARLAYRETSVTKLTNYANSDAQDSLLTACEGDPLTFDEDFDSDAPEGTVWVCNVFPIGRLPKKYASRYIDESAAAVFLDRKDYDDNGKWVPYVKIYW